MKKTDAIREFEETILMSVPKHDKPAIREAWNNWTDMLCKNGRITQKQYDTWDYQA